MSEDYISEESFKGQLDAESLLIMHMNRLSIYRDSDIKRYCSGIETLMIMCPRNIREKAFTRLTELKLQRAHYSNVTPEMLITYDDLVIYINELLEKAHMIWKTKTIKIFE
jgi:hypothetical protein